ncbi:MAG: hypothetical protein ACLFQV_00140 [Vulcanimicrobiota bacterium]
MKRIFIGLLMLALVFGLVTQAWAGVSEKLESKTINENYEHVYDHYEDVVHRIIAGYANRKLGHFAGNDWDQFHYFQGTNHGRSWKNALTAEERTTLNNLKKRDFSNDKVYYLDLTTMTVNTADFNFYSDSTKPTISEVQDKFEQFSDFVNTQYKLNNKDSKTETKTERINPYLTYNRTDTYTHNYYGKHTFELLLYLYDASPLVLDLDQNRKIDTARNSWMPHAPKFYKEFARYFDITGDGERDLIEWMSTDPSDGLLVMPENGKVETALQLFGTAGGYADGYEKLSMVCDTDKNGWVEGEELEGLKIWVDSNNDAVSQDSELSELSDYGITRISTSHKDFVSTYETADGNQHMMWDWWPSVFEVRKFR